MSFKRSLFAAFLAATFSLPALAQDLKPVQSQAIDLGPVAGDAFYTVEHDGFHVVATFAPRQGGTPVRVQALLAPGQSVVFSTPRAVGEPPASVTIQRHNDQVLVRKVAYTD
jgi:hypothetical protein